MSPQSRRLCRLGRWRGRDTLCARGNLGLLMCWYQQGRFAGVSVVVWQRDIGGLLWGYGSNPTSFHPTHYLFALNKPSYAPTTPLSLTLLYDSPFIFTTKPQYAGEIWQTTLYLYHLRILAIPSGICNSWTGDNNWELARPKYPTRTSVVCGAYSVKSTINNKGHEQVLASPWFTYQKQTK